MILLQGEVAGPSATARSVGPAVSLPWAGTWLQLPAPSSLCHELPVTWCPKHPPCSRVLVPALGHHGRQRPAQKQKLKMLHIEAPLFFLIFSPFLESYCELFCRLVSNESAVLAPYYLCENGNCKRPAILASKGENGKDRSRTQLSRDLPSSDFPLFQNWQC